ncbi:hypothetical protein J2T15_003830 [Paenibacillus harenae]|uniref:Nucleoside 2-deoxyribosyltransferase n=1 Tax=Paenibacillus harenae TaxID=306543 RepID=A0ABT9U410_PAEHA|nr:hypothetical protein [Paenibacillus harenae]
MEKKKCFIVTPIGGNNTEIRRHADGVIESANEPILIDHDVELFVSHKMSDPGSITKKILEHILEDDLVIANLTSLNPNVMYELAVRHAVRKPVIVICEFGTSLPFDVSDERTFFYTNDMKGVVELKEALSVAVKHALNDETPDNPIYRASKEINIMKTIEVGENDTLEKYLMNRLDTIEAKVSSMNRNVNDVKVQGNSRKAARTSHDTFISIKIKKGISLIDLTHIIINVEDVSLYENAEVNERITDIETETLLIPGDIVTFRILARVDSISEFKSKINDLEYVVSSHGEIIKA